MKAKLAKVVTVNERLWSCTPVAFLDGSRFSVLLWSLFWN